MNHGFMVMTSKLKFDHTNGSCSTIIDRKSTNFGRLWRFWPQYYSTVDLCLDRLHFQGVVVYIVKKTCLIYWHGPHVSQTSIRLSMNYSTFGQHSERVSYPEDFETKWKNLHKAANDDIIWPWTLDTELK